MNLMTRSIQVSLFLFAGTILSSCGQTFNSNTADNLLLPSNYCEDQTKTLLCDANEVLQTKCTSCHTGYHNTWGAWNTDEQWLANGKVVAGNPAGSEIITRLKTYGTGLTNMPQDDAALTQEEYDKLEAWINSL